MKPFLRWAGGKRQLLPYLLERVPEKFGAYHEPFLGGGALFFALRAQGFKGLAHLSDLNWDLIQTYSQVRNAPESLIRMLGSLENTEITYYQMRNQSRIAEPGAKGAVEKMRADAARFIYLNQTCFNGLYRVNSDGKFNVPYGHRKGDPHYNPELLRAASEALQVATISHQGFDRAVLAAACGDFVYFDPPYVPVKAGAFTSYTAAGFGRTDHVRLADVAGTLRRRRVKVMISNSDTPLVRALYEGWHIESITARRSVGAKVRGKAQELLIRSYK